MGKRIDAVGVTVFVITMMLGWAPTSVANGVMGPL